MKESRQVPPPPSQKYSIYATECYPGSTEGSGRKTSALLGVYKTDFKLVQGVGPPEVYLLLRMFPL